MIAVWKCTTCPWIFAEEEVRPVGIGLHESPDEYLVEAELDELGGDIIPHCLQLLNTLVQRLPHTEFTGQHVVRWKWLDHLQ